MNELEESQVQRQALLGDSSVGAKPRTQERPEPFERVDMHLAEPVAVVVPGRLPRRMADRLVIVAPLDQPAVDVIFIGLYQSPLGYRPLDQRPDRRLVDVGQHPNHDLATSLDHPEDRRLLLGERPPDPLPLQPSSPGGPPFFGSGATPSLTQVGPSRPCPNGQRSRTTQPPHFGPRGKQTFWPWSIRASWLS